MHVPSDTMQYMVDTPATPTAAELIREQEKGTHCRAIRSQVGQPNTDFHIDRHGLLVRRSTIDGVVQIIVLTPLRQRVLILAHYPPVARHSEQHQLNDKLRRKLFWTRMADDGYNTVD